MSNVTVDNIISHLWNWVRTHKDRDAIKDTTRISSVKYDGYVDSTCVDPLSFTVFELSDKGELVIDSATRLMESEAAFFLFINTRAGAIIAVKNTFENQKKLIKQESVQTMKVKIIK